MKAIIPIIAVIGVGFAAYQMISGNGDKKKKFSMDSSMIMGNGIIE